MLLYMSFLQVNSFCFVDLWDLYDQGQGQCHSGRRTATRQGHACRWILHVWQFLHGNQFFESISSEDNHL
jgi:hypothetical protein